MSRHSSDEELRAFLAGPGRRDPRLRQRVVRRLLGNGARRGPGDAQWRRLRDPAAGEVDYDEVLARAEQTFSLFFAEGRPVEEPPGVLLAELVPGAGLEELGRLAGGDNRRAIPVLAKWLIHRSHAARHKEPKEMLHWGLMARLAADSCSVQAVGSRARLADLRARAWGQFGNALRVCGRFREAGEVLATAREYLEAGTGDIALRAMLYQQMAPLRMNQRLFGSARDLLKEAKKIYDEIGEPHCLASALLQEAVISQYAGEPDQALRLIECATPLFDPDERSDLLLVARLNRARAYVSIDQPERALSSFRAAQNNDWRGQPAVRLRATWLEGQLLAGLGHMDVAEEALRSARRGFIERDLAPEVVASTRDLLGLYCRMGKRRELEDTVVETQALFFGRPAEAEVLNDLRELEQMAL